MSSCCVQRNFDNLSQMTVPAFRLFQMTKYSFFPDETTRLSLLQLKKYHCLQTPESTWCLSTCIKLLFLR